MRSEKDLYTLMRMLNVNVVNIVKTIRHAREQGARFFAVSTDMYNPVNLIRSKRIMEMCSIRKTVSDDVNGEICKCRFSDGSLLHGFNQRIAKLQPLSAPLHIRRYFVTSKEAGELCLSFVAWWQPGDFLSKIVGKASFDFLLTLW